MPEQVQRYKRWLTVQQKDERQDNCDRRWLAYQYLSNLLRSLTCGQDRRRTAQHCLNCASTFAISSDRTFHVLSVRHMMHMMHMCIPSNCMGGTFTSLLLRCYYPTLWTSGMLHHPGASLNECKSNPSVGRHTCWHTAIYPAGSATMAIQARASHSNCELHNVERVSSCIWVVELVVPVWRLPSDWQRSTVLSGSELLHVLRTRSTWVILALCGSFHTNGIALK